MLYASVVAVASPVSVRGDGDIQCLPLSEALAPRSLKVTQHTLRNPIHFTVELR